MSTGLDNSHLEVVEENQPASKEDVLNFLIASGVNACSRAYGQEHKDMRDAFISMDLKSIAPTWNHLDDNVKIAVINAHYEDFSAWINSK